MYEIVTCFVTDHWDILTENAQIALEQFAS